MGKWQSKTGLTAEQFRKLTEYCNRSDNQIDNVNRAAALGFNREDNIRVAPGAIVRLAAGSSIGRDCFIGLYSYVNGAVTMGERVLIGPHCAISSNTHGFDVETQCFQGANKRDPIVIGDGSWLASGCVVTPGVTIGKCNLVCANCVVTRDTPAYAIVAGTPGRVVGSVDPDTGKSTWFGRDDDDGADPAGEDRSSGS